MTSHPKTLEKEKSLIVYDILEIGCPLTQYRLSSYIDNQHMLTIIDFITCPY